MHREVVQSLFPQPFKRHVDVALRATGSGHGWDGLAVGLVILESSPTFIIL